MSTTAMQPLSAGVASSAWGAQFSTAAASPEERLLALAVFSQVSQMDAAKVSVNLSFDELSRLRQEVKEAADKAKAAQHHSGFWGAISSVLGSDIGAIASAVAALAAVVATGGAAAAVVAAVASAVSLAAQHAKELGIPPEVAMGIALVAAGAALCCGNAGSLFKVSDAVRKVATDVKLAAGIMAGAASIGSAGALVAKGSYAADAKDAQADARAANGQQELVSMDVDAALELLSGVLDRQESDLSTFAEGNKADHRSSEMILNNFGGAA